MNVSNNTSSFMQMGKDLLPVRLVPVFLLDDL